MRYLCVDFGSTWTKVALVESGRGLIASSAHPTTLRTDVMDGLANARADLLRRGFDLDHAETLACSSAGGGLRIAVIGNERLVTGEAGRRVSLSSGAHVVAIIEGGLAETDLGTLADAKADLIILTGGTDGGNPATLLSSATTLGKAQLAVPVIVAGDATCAGSAAARLGETPHAIADNVVPEIGTFNPGPARMKVREMFLSHVIGGKGLSASSEFTSLVQGPTPDLVLRGTELVAELVGDVVVADVGGATTDVHSVVEMSEKSYDIVGQSPATRTVEGDLGMRWSAATTVLAGRSEALLEPNDPDLDHWVATLTAECIPGSEQEHALDARLATTAMATALRRHAGYSEVLFINGQRIVQQTGTDIRQAHLVIGSGGVLRSAPDRGIDLLHQALATAKTPGRMLPQHTRCIIDAHYLLAPIGLLADRDRDTALILAQQLHP